MFRNNHSKYLIILIGGMFFSNLQAQFHYTHSNNDKIQSILVCRVDAPLTPPVVELNKQTLEISFDDLDANRLDLYYRIKLCNADWTEADNIATNRYMTGFAENPITEYESSFNTNLAYGHYTIHFPNNDVKIKSSGNYAVEIYNLDFPDSVLAVACFSVFETQVGITGSVASISQNLPDGSRQCLNFSILHPKVVFQNSDRDLKVMVMQNHRRDAARWITKPTYNKPNELEYENHSQLFFSGGNEFRRFDITDKRVPGMHIDQIQLLDGFYHFDLLQDQVLFGKTSYTYSPDNNGKVFYQMEDNKNGNTESDYCFVHFYLHVADPYLQGSIHLSGDLTQGMTAKETKMLYNFDTQCYEKTLLLKQGVFEYQYLFQPMDKGSIATPTITEGNYWETENDYTIYIYYRPINEQFDKLIGFGMINSVMKQK